MTIQKWIFDRVLAAVLLIPAMVIIVPCLIIIRCESAGSPLFFQTRLGKNQRPFRLLKIRTMVAGTEDKPTHEVCATKITKAGIFLRKTKIDELPQIWNVLVGDMSFVGPRPCLPSQHNIIAAREALGVFSVSPGITGPAQLAGIDMSTPDQLAKADANYIANQSLKRDLQMILATATGGWCEDTASVHTKDRAKEHMDLK